MGDIDVLSPGLYSTIQDRGRRGNAVYGVPQSGAMDSHAALKANLLLNNNSDAALLEITFSGPRLQFNRAVTACITGACFEVDIDNEPIPQGRVFNIEQGDILVFGALQDGFRAYLSVSGGIDAPVILGSRSQYEGLTEQIRLQKGDTLNIGARSIRSRTASAHIQQNNSKICDNHISVLPGPEYDMLSTVEKEHLVNTDYNISPNSSRMAIQLNEKIKNDLEGITTAATRPGTVQLTPAGRLLILMRDCQVTGGYPRILQLSEMGINKLAQQVPGKSVFFKMLVK